MDKDIRLNFLPEPALLYDVGSSYTLFQLANDIITFKAAPVDKKLWCRVALHSAHHGEKSSC